MTNEKRNEELVLRPRLTRLLCKRVNEQVEVAEHERCPYCHGTRSEIVQGRHETFCDYDPTKDPVHFGFPAAGRRDLEG